MAVLVVDGDARVLSCNEMGREVLVKGDGMMLADGCITARRSHDARAIRKLVGRACAGRGAGTSATGGGVEVLRPPPHAPLALLVVPLRLPTFGLTRGVPMAVVFAVDPESEVQRWDELMRRLYRLTPKESSVAALLLQAVDAAGIAERLGVTLHTARAHLKHIFAKTGTSSQAQLVRVLLTGVVKTEPGERQSGGASDSARPSRPNAPSLPA